MKIELGPFARSGIESFSGPDIATGVHDALLHYTGRPSSQEPIAPPRFFHTVQTASPGAEPDSVFTLAVGVETKAALQREADKHQVPLRRIVRHAVLVYLADMDAAEAKRQGTPEGVLSAVPRPGI